VLEEMFDRGLVARYVQRIAIHANRISAALRGG
jgi:hypothetical protein